MGTLRAQWEHNDFNVSVFECTMSVLLEYDGGTLKVLWGYNQCTMRILLVFNEGTMNVLWE